MIDPKLLRTDPDRVRRSQRARGESVELVDQALAADEARRSSISAFEQARAEQKSLGALIAKASGDERNALLSRTKELAAKVRELDASAHEADEHYTEVVKQFGNIVFEDVPEGGEDDLFVIDTEG
ncbi:MAG: serine--tRNA ligase, partial [Propionibacterium freudenreichii]